MFFHTTFEIRVFFLRSPVFLPHSHRFIQYYRFQLPLQLMEGKTGLRSIPLSLLEITAGGYVDAVLVIKEEFAPSLSALQEGLARLCARYPWIGGSVADGARIEYGGDTPLVADGGRVDHDVAGFWKGDYSGPSHSHTYCCVASPGSTAVFLAKYTRLADGVALGSFLQSSNKRRTQLCAYSPGLG